MPRTRSLPRTRRLLFAAAACASGLLIAELVLLAASALSPWLEYQLAEPWSRNVHPDPVLGHRMSPFAPGHDSRGFRNEHEVETTRMLAVGDSLTYGYAVTGGRSWPRQLARALDLAIYNAGTGDYGPCEYLGAMEALIGPQHERVIVALYLGNDLANAYRTVYMDGRFRKYRSCDASVLESIRRADRIASLRQRALELGMIQESPTRRGSDEPRAPLFKRLHLYRLLRAIRYGLSGAPMAAPRLWEGTAADAGPRPPFVFEQDPRFRTVFRHPALDALTVDLNDPRIAEGWRITQAVVLDIRERCSRSGADLIVAVLPSKLLVYADLIRAAERPEAGHAALLSAAELQDQVRERALDFLESHGIEHVDALAPLTACIDAGTPPYFSSEDYHPNELGYGAIARAISKKLAARAALDAASD